MFLIIPIIIVFLATSYLYLNPELSILMKFIVYFFILLTIATSFYIYKHIKHSLSLQEKNKIQHEINNIFKKLSKEKDETKIQLYKKQIEKLQQEIE